jgi:hypothetical protein
MSIILTKYGLFKIGGVQKKRKQKVHSDEKDTTKNTDIVDDGSKSSSSDSPHSNDSQVSENESLKTTESELSISNEEHERSLPTTLVNDTQETGDESSKASASSQTDTTTTFDVVFDGSEDSLSDSTF